MAHHDWHLIDAAEGIECKMLDNDNVQLRFRDGSTEDMTWAEFNEWRERNDESES